MPAQHWLVAYRRAENARAAEEGEGEREGAGAGREATQAAAGPSSQPTNRPRQDQTTWTRECLARVYGYASLEQMCGRVAEGPQWYDIELDTIAERNLCPWATQQLVRFRAGSLIQREPQEIESGWALTLGYDISEDESDTEDTPSSGPGSNGRETPSSAHESTGGNTPSSPQESDTGYTLLLPRVPQTVAYSIEDHTMVLYQDLTSLFRHHVRSREAQVESASVLANAEMEVLMSRYEDSLAFFGWSSSSTNTPAYLYSGMAERIKQSIIYGAYVSSDRAFFATSPLSTSPWSYLGPKTYLASRLRRQRMPSDMLVVFQNKGALLRELKCVSWGRRRYLRWLERYSELVAKVMWMFDPTFTHRHAAPSYPRVARLEGLRSDTDNSRAVERWRGNWRRD